MKIAVMGAGGVGGYFGARLAASGQDVHFIARGPHLAAIRANGLRVKSDTGDVIIKPAQATDDPAGIGPADIVLFAVKLYDTDSAGRMLAPLIGPETGVVDLQNGVDAEDELAAIVGREHVVGGVAYISARIEEPGVILHVGKGAKLAFGELDGQRSSRVDALATACAAAGITHDVSENIETMIWSKLAMLASMSAISCLTRLPVDQALNVPETAELFRAAMKEVADVAAAKGVTLPDDALAGFTAVTRGGSSIRPSMLVDLERGKPLELDHLSGAVVRAGAELGVATPFHSMALALLKPFVKGGPAA
ncbi:MAG: 2-dehydropantoate 2-reductase [Proteobacteria bacterium]|nr:2-dehydropantoate 2-reductase [Pseudomonadota bacterium]